MDSCVKLHGPRLVKAGTRLQSTETWIQAVPGRTLCRHARRHARRDGHTPPSRKVWSATDRATLGCYSQPGRIGLTGVKRATTSQGLQVQSCGRARGASLAEEPSACWLAMDACPRVVPVRQETLGKAGEPLCVTMVHVSSKAFCLNCVTCGGWCFGGAMFDFSFDRVPNRPIHPLRKAVDPMRGAVRPPTVDQSLPTSSRCCRVSGPSPKRRPHC
jgi:hypothetical protein